ncbi:Hsp20 family protein [Noviherbaspirillum cavernae]|nr:Hsp20 family protein [Noviherbaspirillum cavernae]
MARVQQSIEVNVPIHVVYQQLTRFDQYPQFMQGVDAVRQVDATHLHWRTRIAAQTMQWDAEITEQVPDRCIAWRNIGGPKNTGRMEMQSVTQGKTRVTLAMECNDDDVHDGQRPTSSQPGNPELELRQRAEQDLARLKKLVESGQVTTGAADDLHARHFGYSGEEGSDGQQVAAAGYAAGSEGWDGNEDPGIPETGGGVSGNEHAEAVEISMKMEDEATRPPQKKAKADESSSAAQPASWLPQFLHGWEDPVAMMRRMTEEMDHVFEKFVGRPMSAMRDVAGETSGQSTAGEWMPSLEVAQRGGELVISADLPGVKREDVQLQIQNDKLIIEGDRHHDTRRESGAYREMERSYGHFYREVSLPAGTDMDAASASMRDGVLEVTIPVTRSTQQGRRIDIR